MKSTSNGTGAIFFTALMVISLIAMPALAGEATHTHRIEKP